MNQNQTRPLYTVSIRNESIVLTEKEYLEIIEEMKKTVQNPALSKDNKLNEINKIIYNKKTDRIIIIQNADNLYGTMSGISDINGNSLDNVFFNYKRFAEQIEKAVEEGKEGVIIYDKENKPHTVNIATAMLKKIELLKSCEKDYLNKESNSNEHEEELKEMLEESNKKEPKNRMNESDFNK